MDNHKDQLLDELLKEHAKHGAGNDESFLKEIDERVAVNDTVLEMPERKPSPGNRWALGSGIAACIAIGFSVHYVTKSNQPDTIAYHEVKPSALQEDALAPSSIKKENAAKPSLEANEIVIEKPEMTVQVERKASSPAPSMAKAIAANSSSARSVPVPTIEATELALDFGNENDFGAGWGDGDGSGGGGFGHLGGRPSVHSKKSKIAPQIAICPPAHIRPPVDRPVLSGEKYGGLIDNKWTAPIDERSSLSTFAVDVDTASYANIRRMIREGQAIPKDSVRIEEMGNYFDYQYAQPTDKHPFAVNMDSCASPWDSNNRIVRIGIQGKEIVREQRPATNLVFLLDVSGSMNNANKLPLLKQSMQYLLEELNEEDTVSIVVYAGASGLALPATKVDDIGRQKILEKMNSHNAGGSTAGGQGIQLAYKQAQDNFKKDGVNRVILATDGDFNVGVSDNASLTKMVKEKAKSGTYISVLGFGSGNINDAMLESITNNGNGNYSYIDTIKEGRKVLLEDMMGTMVTIAKDVKVQVEMNPNKVKAYRLIGYANRMLPPEAFLDKKVDAGEIGAGHTVTALYEIIPADGKPFGAQIDASRYFEKPEAKPNPALKDSKEMMFVKLAYKQPDQKIEDESTYFTVPFVDGKSEITTDMQFATSVGLFGMILRDSENKGNGNLAKVLTLAKAGKGPDGKGQRTEFIKLVEKCIEKE